MYIKTYQDLQQSGSKPGVQRRRSDDVRSTLHKLSWSTSCMMDKSTHASRNKTACSLSIIRCHWRYQQLFLPTNDWRRSEGESSSNRISSCPDTYWNPELRDALFCFAGFRDHIRFRVKTSCLLTWPWSMPVCFFALSQCTCMERRVKPFKDYNTVAYRMSSSSPHVHSSNQNLF